MYIDTHCHISSEYYEDIDNIINENKKNGVIKMIISGCDSNSINESLELIQKYDCLYATIGYHPSEADLLESIDFNNLEELLKNEKVVGLGEIGLDYYYGSDNKKNQIKLFEKQLMIAEKLNIPVVIHSRDAVFDTIECLKKYDVKGVIHCFNGSYETANIYITMGFKLGIGGVLTFKNCKLYEVIEKISLDDIVLETDSPYLTPVPYRGKINSSKYISFVAEKIANVKKINLDTVSNITCRNAQNVFKI